MKKIFLIILLILSCTSPQNTIKESVEQTTEDVINKTEIMESIENANSDIEIVKINCWIDLMPGSSGKFHIAGEYSSIDDKLTLSKIRVTQNSEEMFLIKPFIQQKQVDGEIIDLFSTIKGLSLNPFLKTDKNIDLELIFNSSEGDVIKNINNIIIEKTY